MPGWRTTLSLSAGQRLARMTKFERGWAWSITTWALNTDCPGAGRRSAASAPSIISRRGSADCWRACEGAGPRRRNSPRRCCRSRPSPALDELGQLQALLGRRSRSRAACETFFRAVRRVGEEQVQRLACGGADLRMRIGLGHAPEMRVRRVGIEREQSRASHASACRNAGWRAPRPSAAPHPRAPSRAAGRP